jgi:hypothetical protein
MLQDEHAASETVRNMREEHPENVAEITRLQGIAGTCGGLSGVQETNKLTRDPPRSVNRFCGAF